MATFATKLGTTRAGDRTRIWLEGKRLLDHGFAHGAHVSRVWSAGKLVLAIVDAKTFDALPRAERGSVAGSVGRPIIDITGQQVASTFRGSHVAVTYSPNCITIEG